MSIDPDTANFVLQVPLFHHFCFLLFVAQFVPSCAIFLGVARSVRPWLQHGLFASVSTFNRLLMNKRVLEASAVEILLVDCTLALNFVRGVQ